LRAALNIQPTSRVLSIASGGCNSLDLALAGAQEVVAVDLSLPQLAVTELKMAGADLDYPDFLILLGLAEGEAWPLYQAVRPTLSETAREFLDGAEARFETGLLRSGRFEEYLATFRAKVLPLVHSKKRIAQLFEAEDLEAQRAFFDKHWNTWRWRSLFRIFFSRFVMARLGRSKAHFSQVEGKVADRLLARSEHVLTALPVKENPYLQWILTGEFQDLENSHSYLSQSGHAALKELRERVRIIHGSLGDVIGSEEASRFDAFNLSNIGEYLTEEEFQGLYEGLLKGANPGARLGYWNLFVPRHRPEVFADQVRRDEAASARLIQEDRAFFYSAFQVEEVL
jgi:S-adenosylmethionine-diacylglycerol 3-amino-3-carboxypropyl transferase